VFAGQLSFTEEYFRFARKTYSGGKNASNFHKKSFAGLSHPVVIAEIRAARGNDVDFNAKKC